MCLPFITSWSFDVVEVESLVNLAIRAAIQVSYDLPVCQ